MSRIDKVKEATIELTIKNNGYKTLSTRKIAKHAGVSVGYLYRHYKSKEALIEAIVDKHFNEFQNIISQIVKTNPNFEAIVRAYINSLFKLFEKDSMKLHFLIVIINDINFFTKINQEKSLSEKKDFLYFIYQKGIENSCIDPEKVNFIMFVSIFISLPFSYLTKFDQLKQTSLDLITKEELIESKEQLITICLDAMK
jgi:hypothetical protein